MTVTIAVLASVVAVAAAVRSTWSPCGLSMLSSITPVSERAKGHAYRTTAAWFVLGAVVGGATLGAVMALLAGGLHALHPSATVLGLIGLVAALVAFGSDADVVGRRLPYHRRQVNERWLDQYRPWVYAAGFGWQIGNGLSTYITTAAVYLLVVLAALTTNVVVAIALGMGFGLLRGLAVLLTRKVSSATQLLAFHRRMAALGPPVGTAVTVVEAGVALLLALTLWSPAALVLVVVAGGVAGVGRVGRRGPKSVAEDRSVAAAGAAAATAAVALPSSP